MDLKALIREIPDFPKPGILFRDITTLLSDAEGLQHTVDKMAETLPVDKPDYIAGIESRGFIFGMPLAYKLGCGFVPVRKAGKLPGRVHRVKYALEYGQDALEVHQDALPTGSTVLVVDDLLATGGTAAATAQLMQQTGATLAGFSFVIELADLGGRQRLPETVPVSVLIQY
ncbi:MAG: adenine phosphoribosyltransferase [Cyanobacteria bacterium P01_A01_bin.105]